MKVTNTVSDQVFNLTNRAIYKEINIFEVLHKIRVNLTNYYPCLDKISQHRVQFTLSIMQKLNFGFNNGPSIGCQFSYLRLNLSYLGETLFSLSNA